MLVKETDFTVEGDMPGETMAMTLSSEALEHIMTVLSDLYSDKVGALVREYITNGLDSHAISGQTRPVEVSTPSRLSPNLVIRDYGAGMSKQVLRDVFREYGNSTKRNNNIETGRLGFGAKSAFAYTDQFTVRSISEGYCCEIIMSRNEHGSAELNVAYEYETGDDNGVTVTIPIKSYDIDDAIEKVKKFGWYAKPGSVLINGTPNRMPTTWKKLGENLFSTDQSYHEDVVVMGNVGYPAKLFENNYGRYNKPSIVAFVEMGAVDFVPSREALKDTPHTKRTLAAVETYIRKCIEQEVSSGLNGTDTRKQKIESYTLSKRWESIFPGLTSNFQGEIKNLSEFTEHIEYQLPRDINVSTDRLRNWGENSPVVMNPYYTLGNYVGKKFNAVVDFPGKRLSRQQTQKILTKKPEFAGGRLVLFANGEDKLSDLFEHWDVISWNDVKDIKTGPTRSPKKGNRVIAQQGGSYRGYMVHNRTLVSGNPRMLKPTGPAFYCSQKEFNELNVSGGPRGDYKIFIVIPSKQEVFIKKNPHITSLSAYIRNRRRQLNKHVQNSPVVKRSLPYAARYGTYGFLSRLDRSRIKSDEILDLMRLARRANKWYALIGHYHYGESKFDVYMRENYPLLSAGSSNEAKYINHAVQYINMIGEKNVNA